jgi:hypothetical protein
VHPLAAGRAGRDDAGGREAAIPPVVRCVAAHRLGGIAAHADARDRALRAEQVVRGLGFDVEDVVFKVVPERAVGERQLADLLALREDRQAAALVVEVLELDCLECALAQPVVEQQAQAQPVSEVGLLGDDRAALVGGEGRAVDLPAAGALDQQGRVAVEVSAHDLEAEEVFDDGEVLVVGARRPGAPQRVEELFDALGASGRLEVLDLEVEEVAGELVQAALVVAVA